MLMPSTCTARLTRAYTSTLNTFLVSHKTQQACNVLLELKCGGLLLDRHEPPFIRRFVVYFRTAVYSSGSPRTRCGIARLQSLAVRSQLPFEPVCPLR